MKKFLLASVAIAVMATPAFAQTAAEKTGVNSTLGIAPKTEDFVKEVAISDMFEIESSKFAQAKAKGPVKDFAAKMVSDHTKTSGELKSMVSAGKVKAPLPSALDSGHQSKLDKLKSLNGDDFTKQY